MNDPSADTNEHNWIVFEGSNALFPGERTVWHTSILERWVHAGGRPMNNPREDGAHRHYTDAPCPWAEGLEFEIGESEPFRIATVHSGTPVGEMMWHTEGKVLCSIIRDGEDAYFAAEPAMVRDAFAAMKARLKKP